MPQSNNRFDLSVKVDTFKVVPKDTISPAVYKFEQEVNDFWWEPGKFDPHSKLRFLDYPDYQKIQFKPTIDTSKPREIGALWGYEMTRELAPVESKFPSETLEKLSKWWEEELKKSFCELFFDPKATTNTITPKEEPQKMFTNSKTLLKRVLSHKDTSVIELSTSSVILSNGGRVGEMTCRIRFNDEAKDIWEERDEVCTERRIADLEKKNAELKKDGERLRTSLAEAHKLINEQSAALQQEKRNNAWLKVTLSGLYGRMQKTGLFPKPKNQKLLAYPGQHADWRKIVEVENDGDNQ